MTANQPAVAHQQFRELFDSVLPSLHNFVARQCAPAEVDDVIADIMAEVFARWSRAPAGIENQRMWVFGFARNKLKELARRNRYRTALMNRAVLSAGDGTSELATNIEANDRVKHLLSRISEKEQEVVYLTVFAGFNTAETAAILGISISAVTTRASRAKQHLKKILETE